MSRHQIFTAQWPSETASSQQHREIYLRPGLRAHRLAFCNLYAWPVEQRHTHMRRWVFIASQSAASNNSQRLLFMMTRSVKCAARGCPRITPPANGRALSLYRGSSFHFVCNPGFELNGPRTVYCVDGRRWNGSVPRCEGNPSERS